jgi:tetratricopeptide (TPR) repeat protein
MESVQIIDTGEPVYYPYTNYADLGPQVGNIINAHYFPGMKYYEAGRYRNANNDLSYFIDRSNYTNGNPNQAYYMSTALYARGMIFLHHASGFGRLSLALNDFDAAIKWNSKNYLAYLELSRVFSIAGLNDQAVSILQALLDQHPDDAKVVEDAQRELNAMTRKVPADGSSPPAPLP